MVGNWYSFIKGFYLIVEPLKRFLQGFFCIFWLVFIALSGKYPVWKCCIALILILLGIFFLSKLLWSLFELATCYWYDKDPVNYKEGGVVLNKVTRKLEGLNRKITVSERRNTVKKNVYMYQPWIPYLSYFTGVLAALILIHFI
jgi:hypothetical protein